MRVVDDVHSLLQFADRDGLLVDHDFHVALVHDTVLVDVLDLGENLAEQVDLLEFVLLEDDALYFSELALLSPQLLLQLDQKAPIVSCLVHVGVDQP